ncbi:MAG: outer membrane protein assembly factor BamD [Alphaproteobacteria bacterium]|nr:outer membrane protein assembly factor BamD [Alphaproteobacteria bacterium]
MVKSKFLIWAAALLILTGCANKDTEQEQLSVERLYNRAHKRLKKTQYKGAAETFEQVELEYPYSQWATEAKLMGAYAYYKDESYDDAVMALDRFIRFHPGNKNIAYAYYLKAVCYFDQISDVRRDQGETAKALESLEQLVLRFPTSKYADDARKKIVFARGHIAGQEMEIGRYYFKQHNYLSALNRFSNVVNNYQNTEYIDEALYRQYEIYTILGLPNEASKAKRFLEIHYPQSPWKNKIS